MMRSIVLCFVLCVVLCSCQSARRVSPRGPSSPIQRRDGSREATTPRLNKAPGTLAPLRTTRRNPMLARLQRNPSKSPKIQAFYEFLVKNGLNNLCKMIKQANIEDILLSIGSFTIFAPSDDCFVFLTGDVWEGMRKDNNKKRQFIMHHVVPGTVSSADVRNDLLVEAAEGSPIRLNIYPKTKVWTASGAQITQPDLRHGEFTVHIVDSFLYPLTTMNALDFIRGSFDNFYRMLAIADPRNLLSGGTFTIFVPTDAAFKALPEFLQDAIYNNNSVLQSLLLNHILPSTFYTVGLPMFGNLTSLDDNPIRFKLRRGMILVNGIPIVEPDISVTIGVIHVLNRVLLPPNIFEDCNCVPTYPVTTRKPTTPLNLETTTAAYTNIIESTTQTIKKRRRTNRPNKATTPREERTTAITTELPQTEETYSTVRQPSFAPLTLPSFQSSRVKPTKSPPSSRRKPSKTTLRLAPTVPSTSTPESLDYVCPEGEPCSDPVPTEVPDCTEGEDCLEDIKENNNPPSVVPITPVTSEASRQKPTKIPPNVDSTVFKTSTPETLDYICPEGEPCSDPDPTEFPECTESKDCLENLKENNNPSSAVPISVSTTAPETEDYMCPEGGDCVDPVVTEVTECTKDKDCPKDSQLNNEPVVTTSVQPIKNDQTKVPNDICPGGTDCLSETEDCVNGGICPEEDPETPDSPKEPLPNEDCENSEDCRDDPVTPPPFAEDVPKTDTASPNDLCPEGTECPEICPSGQICKEGSVGTPKEEDEISYPPDNLNSVTDVDSPKDPYCTGEVNCSKPQLQDEPPQFQDEPPKLQDEPPQFQDEPPKLQDEPPKSPDEPPKLQDEPAQSLCPVGNFCPDVSNNPEPSLKPVCVEGDCPETTVKQTETNESFTTPVTPESPLTGCQNVTCLLEATTPRIPSEINNESALPGRKRKPSRKPPGFIRIPYGPISPQKTSPSSITPSSTLSDGSTLVTSPAVSIIYPRPNNQGTTIVSESQYRPPENTEGQLPGPVTDIPPSQSTVQEVLQTDDLLSPIQTTVKYDRITDVPEADSTFSTTIAPEISTQTKDSSLAFSTTETLDQNRQTDTTGTSESTMRTELSIFTTDSPSMTLSTSDKTSTLRTPKSTTSTTFETKGPFDFFDDTTGTIASTRFETKGPFDFSDEIAATSASTAITPVITDIKMETTTNSKNENVELSTNPTLAPEKQATTGTISETTLSTVSNNAPTSTVLNPLTTARTNEQFDTTTQEAAKSTADSFVTTETEGKTTKTLPETPTDLNTQNQITPSSPSPEETKRSKPETQNKDQITTSLPEVTPIQTASTAFSLPSETLNSQESVETTSGITDMSDLKTSSNQKEIPTTVPFTKANTPTEFTEKMPETTKTFDQSKYETPNEPTKTTLASSPETSNAASTAPTDYRDSKETSASPNILDENTTANPTSKSSIDLQNTPQETTPVSDISTMTNFSVTRIPDITSSDQNLSDKNDTGFTDNTDSDNMQEQPENVSIPIEQQDRDSTEGTNAFSSSISTESVTSPDDSSSSTTENIPSISPQTPETTDQSCSNVGGDCIGRRRTKPPQIPTESSPDDDKITKGPESASEPDDLMNDQSLPKETTGPIVSESSPSSTERDISNVSDISLSPSTTKRSRPTIPIIPYITTPKETSESSESSTIQTQTTSQIPQTSSTITSIPSITTPNDNKISNQDDNAGKETTPAYKPAPTKATFPKFPYGTTDSIDRPASQPEWVPTSSSVPEYPEQMPEVEQLQPQYPVDFPPPNSIDDVLSRPGLVIGNTPVTFNVVLKLFNNIGLTDILLRKGPYTLCVPTDAAFNLLPHGYIDRLQHNGDLLRKILLHHVITSQLPVHSLRNNLVIRTYQGLPVVINVVDSGKLVLIGGTRVLGTTRTRNGVLYIVNRVFSDLPEYNLLRGIRKNPNLSLFYDYCMNSPLKQVLRARGPFTVAAPTNDAFRKLSPDFLNLLATNQRSLEVMLYNHLVSGAVFSSSVTRELSFVTPRGATLRFRTSPGGGLEINNAHVSIPDISAGNGVLHVVDQVLLSAPPITDRIHDEYYGDASNPSSSQFQLSDLAQNLGCDTFVKWFQSSGLLQKVMDGGRYTLLAPTDSAVQSLPPTTLRNLQENPSMLEQILKYHVLEGYLQPTAIGNEDRLPTLLPGKDVRCNWYKNESELTLSGAKLGLDRRSGGVVVQVINRVLYPPSGDVMTTVSKSPLLQDLTLALRRTGMDNIISSLDSPFTLFAPTNEAFRNLPKSEYNRLFDSPEELKRLLSRYLAQGTLFTSGVSNGMRIKALSGEDIIITIKPQCIVVNGVNVLYSDITATNGVVHVINHLI